MSARMVDRYGRVLDLISLDRCDGHGPQPWIRVSWRGVLLGPGTPGLGPGYYRAPDMALVHLDIESLVEVVELRP